jgi:sugar phosphate isomerase/epimerase
MKLSLLNYILVPSWPLERIVRTASAMGCAGIELRIERGFAAGPELEASSQERRRIRQEVADAGLEIACLGTNSSFDTPDPRQRQAVVEHSKRLIELAADVGCQRIRVFGDRLPQDVPPLECARYVGEVLRPLGEFAESFDVDVLLEMHNDFNDPDLALTAVQTADHPRVALVYNSDPRDLVDGSLQATYERVRPWIRHVHLHELGNGFPYQELFALLQADGYTGYLSTELEEQDTITAYLLTYAALFRTWANQSAAATVNGGRTLAMRER